MTREELKEHCKKTVEQCEMWAIHRNEEPSGKVYEEHKAILDILEQEPCEEAISREALDEMIDWLCRLKSEINAVMDMAIVPRQNREKYCEILSKIIEWLIYNIPSVTPSRRKGHSELKALIDKHRMYRLADDELSEFERDVLELADMRGAE